jgi:hypothetical protein
MMFKKNKGPGSTPSTPKIGNISLPGEDDILRAGSPFKRLMNFNRKSSPAPVEKPVPSGVSATKLREVHPLQKETTRIRVESFSVEGRASKHRSRSDSVTSGKSAGDTNVALRLSAMPYPISDDSNLGRVLND